MIFLKEILPKPVFFFVFFLFGQMIAISSGN